MVSKPRARRTELAPARRSAVRPGRRQRLKPGPGRAEISGMNDSPAPTPGKSTSEFKLALLTVGASVLLGGLKVLGVAAVATGQWWAVPVSLALTSLGYSLSRGLVKRGVIVHYPAPVTDGETSGIPR